MNPLTPLDELNQYSTSPCWSAWKSRMRFLSTFTSTSKTARRPALAQRASVLRQILKGNHLAELDRALCKIDAYLAAEILPEAKGLAIFVHAKNQRWLPVISASGARIE